MLVSSLVAVDAGSSMGDVVDFGGELLVASLEDDSWDLGGVSGRLGERTEVMDMGSKGFVVELADCACAVCAGEVCGFFGNHSGGVRGEDMFGDDGW